MTETSSPAQWPVFRRAARTVVVVDVVESVRLYEEDEEDTVRRWQAFVGEVVTRLLPQHAGRLVKSLGDGLMLEFEAVPPAIQCAIAMHSAISHIESGRGPATAPIWLRVGAHVADVYVDAHDIYGSGVNLAARLAGLAGPGETVVSAAVRDRLTPGLDPELEDLGECHLKHLAAPVRAYRVGPAGVAPVVAPRSERALRTGPVLAVIPMRGPADADPEQAIGQAFADELIAWLSRSADLCVISRLSTAGLGERTVEMPRLRQLLDADYALSGSFVTSGQRIRLRIELAETASQQIVWADAMNGRLDDLLQPEGDLLQRVVSAVESAVVTREIERSRQRSMPTLQSHTLLLGSISAMHRASDVEFARACSMLEHLVERHPREPAPRAWLGKWHVMRTVQGLSRDRLGDAAKARDTVARALDLEPSHSLALAIDGLVSALLLHDLNRAEARYAAALAANPNESLAWLWSSALHFYRGEGAAAGEAAEHAIRLSPLDPLKYYYDTFAATAMLSAQRFGEAIALAQRSLRANCLHTATYRTLAIAQVLQGDLEAGRATTSRMLALEPALTVRSYVERFPGTRELAKTYGEALRSAGLPL